MRVFTFIFLMMGVGAYSQSQEEHYSDAPQWQASCRYCQMLKNQAPTGGGTWAAQNINNNDRSDTIDVLHYDITLDITDFAGQTIAGNCVLRFSPKMNNVSSISLDLLELTIDSILLDGQIVSNYSYNDTLIQVPFGVPMNDADTAEVQVFYRGHPLPDPSWGGFYFQQGYAYNIGVGFSSNPHTIGRMWHPCFDNFVERATYTFNITTTAPKKAHCNGYLAGEASMGSLLTRTWEMEQPIPTYLACVAVNDYATVNLTHTGISGNIPIELVALAGDTTNLKNSFANLGTAIDAFEYWYGDHQWSKVGYTVVPFAAGAMEHATNIFYPKFAVNGNLQYENLMAHELGHHWWGDLATCETAEDMWINEGMATYGEFLFTERQYGWNAYITAMKSHHYDVMRNAHLAEGGYLAISGIPHQYTYGDHVYNKGASVAHNLRWYLGDSLYREGMSAVTANHSFKSLNSYQMLDRLTATTGIDMAYFFNDWVFSGGFSHFEIDKVTVQEPIPATFVATVRIQQKLLGTTNYHSYVPLQLTFRDENWNVHHARVMVSGAQDSAVVSLPFYPTTVIINEEHRLNQAREDKQGMIYGVGGYNQLMPNLSVQAVGDSAFFHFEHHLVAPDPSDMAAIELSGTHYWTVTGVFPDTFKATARLSLDTDYDSDLIQVYGADSLRLFYRASPEFAWEEHPAYTKTQLFPLVNFNISNLLVGDYALGNFYQSLSGVSPTQTAFEQSVLLFPNPNNGTFQLQWQSQTAAEWNADVYDALGRLVSTQNLGLLSAGQQLQTLSLPAHLPSGNYWLRLQNADGDCVSVVLLKS